MRKGLDQVFQMFTRIWLRFVQWSLIAYGKNALRIKASILSTKQDVRDRRELWKKAEGEDP